MGAAGQPARGWRGWLQTAGDGRRRGQRGRTGENGTGVTLERLTELSSATRMAGVDVANGTGVARPAAFAAAPWLGGWRQPLDGDDLHPVGQHHDELRVGPAQVKGHQS